MKEPVSQDSLQRGYEARDLPVRPFLYVSAGFIAGLVLVCLLLGLFFHLLLHVFPHRQSGASLVEKVRDFPVPELQTDPGADYAAFLAKQTEVLNNYAWVDRQRGLVRVPVEDAMKRLLQQPPPVRSPNVGPTETEMIQQKNEVYPRRIPQ
jgi:hypothetical protein